MDSATVTKILDELPAQVAWRRADSIVKDTPDWFQVRTPSSKVVPLNGVYRSIIAPGKMDATIQNTIEEFKKYETQFRWIITGNTRPMDLPRRLENFNFKKVGEALGLAADVADVMEFADDKIKVVELTEEFLEEWIDAGVVGWGSPEAIRAMRIDVPIALKEQRSTLRYYSAMIGTKIVGTGVLRFCDRSAHLLGSCVRPDFRGRGIYRALVANRAKVANEHGLNLMTTHGLVTTSAPILKKIGFRQYSEMRQYSFGP